MDSQALYGSLVAVHGLAGALSLLSAVVPMVARKGRSIHRKSGWIFVAAMTITAATGWIIAGLWLAVPLAVQALPATISDDQAAAVALRMRIFAVLLVYLALLIASTVWHGLRAVRARRSPTPLGRHVLDRSLPVAMLVGGIAVLVFGLLHDRVVHIAFGALGATSGYTDLRFALAPAARRTQLIVRHLGAMIGAVIAAVTAFAVFGAGPRLADVLPGHLTFLPWLAPTVLGIPLIAWWGRRYRRAL